MTNAILAVAGLVIIAVVLSGWLRSVLHRTAAATGDPSMAAVLAGLAGSRTRLVAAALVDLNDSQIVRSAGIGADAETRFEIGSVTKGMTGMLLAISHRARSWTMDAYAPAGGVISTSADMTTLVRALLDGSAPGASATTSLLPIAGDPSARDIGMFWMIDHAPGTERTMVWHNGQTGGYSSFVALYPQARRGVVVLANVARAKVAQRVATGLTEWLVRGDRGTL
jgi:CubicO group peptidase (beta-lactamase class C family)